MMINRIQRMKVTGGKGISSKLLSNSVPPGCVRKIPSNSNSPVVMVRVLRMERAGEAKGVRWNGNGHGRC